MPRVHTIDGAIVCHPGASALVAGTAALTVAIGMRAATRTVAQTKPGTALAAVAGVTLAAGLLAGVVYSGVRGC